MYKYKCNSFHSQNLNIIQHVTRFPLLLICTNDSQFLAVLYLLAVASKSLKLLTLLSTKDNIYYEFLHTVQNAELAVISSPIF